MGHGLKANILSDLTASIIVKMGEAKEPILSIDQTILNPLPVCNVKGLSYSTFNIIDIDHNTNITTIVDYDNPQTIVLRAFKSLKLTRDKIIDNSHKNNVKTIQTLFQSQFFSRTKR